MNETARLGTGLIQIVPFAARHTDGIGALIVGIQRDEFQIPITLEDQPDLQNIPAFYQKGAGNFWVALSEDGVVGTVALLDLGNHQAALRKMFVHAAYRGSGHGVSARLLETLLEWSRGRGVKEVYLGTTEKFLAAHRFYERNGFQQITATELPPAFPKMAVDTRFYLLRTPFRCLALMHLFETHLTVADTAGSQAFYTSVVGLEFAHRDLTRDIVFLWAGEHRRSMLGLWGPTTTRGRDFHKSHLAFAISLPELLAVGERLRTHGVTCRDFGGETTDEPSVIGWMPSAQLYFRDPDGHSVEFITVLNDPPEPSFIGSLSEWRNRGV